MKKLSLALICLFLFNCSEVLSQPAKTDPSNQGAKPQKDKKDKRKNDLLPLTEISRNVMILDKHKKLPLTIKAEDLKILEDGIEQKISRLESRNVYLNLGIVIDNSNSSHKRLPEIQTLTNTILQGLDPAEEMFLIRFIDSLKIEVVQDWTTNHDEMAKGLAYLFTEWGQTALFDALYLSAEKMLAKTQKDPSRENVLIVVSDFEERNSYYQLADLLAALRNKPVQIYCIALTGHLDERIRKRSEATANGLSLFTGGSAYFIDGLQDAPKTDTSQAAKDQRTLNILNSLIYEIRSQYRVIYTPIRLTHDKLPRSFKVEFSGDANGRTILANDKFFVAKDFYKTQK